MIRRCASNLWSVLATHNLESGLCFSKGSVCYYQASLERKEYAQALCPIYVHRAPVKFVDLVDLAPKSSEYPSGPPLQCRLNVSRGHLYYGVAAQ